MVPARSSDHRPPAQPRSMTVPWHAEHTQANKHRWNAVVPVASSANIGHHRRLVTRLG